MRNGKRAVRLAEPCRKSEGERADILDVLASAYAEAGRYQEAVRTAGRALQIQEESGENAIPGLAERLDEYRAGRLHRQ